MKAILVLALTLALGGCSMFSGNSTEEIAVDASGIALKGRFGEAVKLKTKQSQAAAISDNAERTLVAMAQLESKRLDLEIAKAVNNVDISCYTLSTESFDKLQAVPKDTYIREASQCQREQRFTSVISMLGDVIAGLSKPTSDIASVADSYGTTIRSVASEGTKKLQAVVNPLAVTIGVRERERTAQRNGDNYAKSVKYAAENAGDVTATISTTIQPSADGNTGGSGTSGDGGAGTGGSGSGSSDVVTGETNYNIGRGVYDTDTSDTAQALIDSDGSQILSPNSKGAVNNQSNVDQQPIVDDQNAELNNQPRNGSDNSVL